MEKYPLLNIKRFAEENAVDLKFGFLTKQTLLGKNASINLTQMKPGANFRSHYHNVSDEIDFVIQGEANMMIDGEIHPIKPGDLIYIPPGTIHGFDAFGAENLLVLVIFAPPLDEKDRTFV